MIRVNFFLFLKIFLLFLIVFYFTVNDSSIHKLPKVNFDYRGVSALDNLEYGNTIKNLILMSRSDAESFDTLLLPPVGLESLLFYTGIGTPITYKRFYEPSEDFFAKLWLYCDPYFTLPDIKNLEKLVKVNNVNSEKKFSTGKIVQCYDEISSDTLIVLSQRLSVEYALVPKQNFNSMKNYIEEIYPSPYMVIKIDELASN